MSKETGPVGIQEIFENMEGGQFIGRVEKAIADSALATVVRDGKAAKGKVDITLTFERIAESSQVRVIANVKFDAPTSRGRRSESYACETPMHVEKGGRLTLFPEAQPLFKGANAARGGE